jgi:hypothetical protein
MPHGPSLIRISNVRLPTDLLPVCSLTSLAPASAIHTLSRHSRSVPSSLAGRHAPIKALALWRHFSRPASDHQFIGDRHRHSVARQHGRPHGCADHGLTRCEFRARKRARSATLPDWPRASCILLANEIMFCSSNTVVAEEISYLAAWLLK